MPSRISSALLAILVVSTLALGACGEDNGLGLEDGDGTPSDTLPPDTPPLPIPATSGSDVPPTSDTVTVITALGSDYRPRVQSITGDWTLRARACWASAVFICGTWGPYATETATGLRNDELPDVQVALLPAGTANVSMALAGPLGRILLLSDGAPIVPTYDRVATTGSLVNQRQTEHDFTGDALADTVYLRRDRFWQRQQLSTGDEFLLLQGDSEASLESSYTTGTSTTETEEFGRSLTASAGLSLGPLTVGVEGTLSETFSTSVEISQSSTETFTRTVRSAPGSETVFRMWSLVERYMFTDAAGDPYLGDANFEVVPDTLYRRGVATALQATSFDLP